MNVFLPDHQPGHSSQTDILLCCFNLIYLIVRQTVGRNVDVSLASLQAWTWEVKTESSNAWPSSVIAQTLKSWLESVTIWHALLNLFQFLFSLKQSAFYVEANVSVWICLGCLYSAIRFPLLITRPPPSMAFPALSPPKCLDGKRQSDLKVLQILKPGDA